MGCCASEDTSDPSSGGSGGGGGQRRDIGAALARPDGYNAPFLQRHAPNGEVWADYLAPVPPLVNNGVLSGAWAECVYAGVVFEMTNPGWEQMPGYSDGPVGILIAYLNACGYGQHSSALEQAEQMYHQVLEQPSQQGSKAFLQHKARNGQTWEQYLRASKVEVGPSGYVCGAWGECITAAVIFEHENPEWNNLGPYSADGPAGQVCAFISECGHGDKEQMLSRTEEATHNAVTNGSKLPVFDATNYQAPVQVMQAPEVNRPPPRPSGRKKALLIGCNYPGQKAELSGCVNDVHRWTSMLTSRFNFDPSSIVHLTDQGHNDYSKFPTRSNFIAGIRWLTEGAQPGDVLFFQFSGHGGQRECKDGSEADGMDEVLIPTDFQEAGTIVDHELFDLLCVPLPSGCKLTVILDCCHSGSALDLPFTWEGNQWQMDPSPWHTAGDVQMFSGCEDSQCSMDVTRHGKAGGAMTTAACDVIERGQAEGSYPDLLNSLLGVLTERGFEQRPRLSSSQPFNVAQKPFSIIEHIVPNLNPQLGQENAHPPKPGRTNVGDFKW